jgi:hypothetical protein
MRDHCRSAVCTHPTYTVYAPAAKAVQSAVALDFERKRRLNAFNLTALLHTHTRTHAHTHTRTHAHLVDRHREQVKVDELEWFHSQHCAPTAYGHTTQCTA